MRELVRNYEAWDVETAAFDHTVTVWKDGENYYQLSHSSKPGAFDLDNLPMPSSIPQAHFRGRWHSSLTECQPPFPPDSYQKNPAIMLPDDYDAADPSYKTPGEHMLIEAEIYEILKQLPHPNVCHYYGCVRGGQYVTAIVLKKYKHSLHHALQSGAALDRDAILSGIEKGLKFLHDTHGLVHNDINPTNIMLDDKGLPVIIDFDSCGRIGEDLTGRKGGTFGWVKKPEPRISTVESDDYALSLIARYMDGQVVDGLPVPPEVSVSMSPPFLP